MYDHTLSLYLQNPRLDIKQHVKWAVNLVIVHGHLTVPQGLLWVCMGFAYSAPISV